MYRVIHILAYPITVVVKGRKHWIRFAVGSMVAISGVMLAKHPPELLGHIVADALGYGVHAIGFSHVLKVITDVLHVKIEP